jgi:hypothetical protein
MSPLHVYGVRLLTSSYKQSKPHKTIVKKNTLGKKIDDTLRVAACYCHLASLNKYNKTRCCHQASLAKQNTKRRGNIPGDRLE